MSAAASARRFLVMGLVEGAFGVKGWIHVRPYTESAAGLLDYPRWWVGGRETEVLEARVHGAGLIASLAGIVERDQAHGLKGQMIEVPRDWLPAPAEGEVYWADLVGLAVENEAGEVLGRVKQVFSNGGHDVLELVTQDGAARLIPYVAEFLREVDLPGGRIRVSWGSDW